MALFEFSGIDELVDDFDLIRKNYPKEVKRFMQSEGRKLRNRTLKTAKTSVGKKTGNYQNSIKTGKYYKYDGNGADSIRVYIGNRARHGHLIELGHEMVGHKPDKKDTGEFVKGYHIFKTSADMFESIYDSDCEKFADKITEPLNKG